MSDQTLSAGARMAAARRQRGLSLDLLATQMKVPVARLEALEREQWDQLPDATHARALATSVCRVLELDPAPILAAMPRGAGPALERVSQGLNQPVRSSQGSNLARWGLAALLLVLALIALGLSLWPRDAESLIDSVGLPTSAEPTLLPASAASEAALPASVAEPASLPQQAPPPATLAASAAASQLLASAPASAPALAAPVAAPPTGSALLEIRASRGASWVSVSDAAGTSLAAQLLNEGEVLSLSPRGSLPLRLTLGNAPALELRWRGQPQALEGYEQRRVAKLELK